VNQSNDELKCDEPPLSSQDYDNNMIVRNRNASQDFLAQEQFLSQNSWRNYPGKDFGDFGDNNMISEVNSFENTPLKTPFKFGLIGKSLKSDMRFNPYNLTSPFKPQKTSGYELEQQFADNSVYQ